MFCGKLFALKEISLLHREQFIAKLLVGGSHLAGYETLAIEPTLGGGKISWLILKFRLR